MNCYMKRPELGYYYGLQPLVNLEDFVRLGRFSNFALYFDYQNLCCLPGKGFVVYKHSRKDFLIWKKT